MIKGRWIEAFEVNDVISMRNVTIFITIVVASIVVVYMALADTLEEMIFAAYVMAGGGVYSFGKYRDSKECIAETEAAAAPATIISDNTKVETQTGDINVERKKDANPSKRPPVSKK